MSPESDNFYDQAELVQLGHHSGRSRSSVKDKSHLPGVFIKTFGCQMNEYDSEKLMTILDGKYRPVDTPEEAKLLLVNTCSVREKPEHKLYSYVGKLRELKLEDPEVLIGVGGCVAQQEGKNIIRRSSAVDFVFGTHNLSLVPSLIEMRQKGHQPQVAIDYRDEWEELPLGLPDRGRVSVFVSISRGCNKSCTYCIVPTTRGPEVSRAPKEILTEVRIAAHRGAREVVLLGQTVNSYGLDMNPRMKFVELMEQVSEIEGIERIRFTSPHPQEIRKDFYELIANNTKVCRHVHMPLQSGSDSILKAMNRNYRKKRYLQIIEGLREVAPDVAITTDVIVGFPGETREDFLETLDVMRAVEFDSSFSFIFSSRPGTKAAEMEDQVPHEEKLARLQELQALQDEHTARRLAAWNGKRVEVLFDGFSKSDPKKLQGRTSQNLFVNMEEERLQVGPGMLADITISGVSRYTLKGRFLSSEAAS